MSNQLVTSTSPYHEKLQKAEERAQRSKDAVSSAQKMKHETKLAQMEAEAVLAESATDPFSPQSIRKKVREVRLALNRARQEKEEAARELVWAEEQEAEAKMFRLDLQKKVDDATEMVTVEEAKLEELESTAYIPATTEGSRLLQSSSPHTTPCKTNSSKSKARSEAMIEFERAKAEHEASKENLQRARAELRDAQKKLAAERAADEAYVSADTSRAGRAGARAARKDVFLTPSRSDSKRDRKSNKSPPKILSNRSKMLNAAKQKSKDTGSNAIAAEEWKLPSQVEIVSAVVTMALLSLMFAIDKPVLADMPNLLAVYLSGILDSIVIFFTQLGDYTTHKTISATNAASVALHNATFATKSLGRQALSEALGISLMLKGNILSAASSAVELKDTVVDTTCAALQGLGK
mmetsp:Transcript_22799/g.35076  ORF Transcript_22799/g.35076 Transcript_22799/m.35076 type:complete len:408 (+) Transcript_22799:201-1424(+)|eukprot:CAMPEP_0196805480 /NCGR_PEP_ID=MMETSP1362-20130617/5253_1 /TAXON_ID=163516 /ORGANISM="Leptocylindrus danicus, Strain CCMP1856" /LENGTH=407 /DNA_ID=CAMNT_0042178429 /DNA_START=155 /DNA_END=1378 /DNA_ORIENTATION=+